MARQLRVPRLLPRHDPRTARSALSTRLSRCTIRSGSASRSRKGASLRTFPTQSRRVMSLTQMRRKTAPLRDVIEGFFRSNYDLSPKTATWYRQNLEGFVTFVEKMQG